MPKRLCFQKNGRIPLHGTNLTWSTHKNNIYLQFCEKQLDILHCCLSRWCCCYLLVYNISDLQQRFMYSFDCRYKFVIAGNIYSSGWKFIAKLQDAPCLDCDLKDTKVRFIWEVIKNFVSSFIFLQFEFPATEKSMNLQKFRWLLK